MFNGGGGGEWKLKTIFHKVFIRVFLRWLNIILRVKLKITWYLLERRRKIPLNFPFLNFLFKVLTGKTFMRFQISFSWGYTVENYREFPKCIRWTVTIYCERVGPFWVLP